MENVFDLVHKQFKRYVAVKEHEHIGLTLWTLHTHVYRQFGVTPRLLLMSPIENCGKTTVLNLVTRLSCRPEYTVDITAAALARTMELSPTMLVDEADNLGIERNRLMKSILNGNYVGATRRIVLGGEPHSIDLFTPVALASIGILPGPLTSRCVVIHMHRPDPEAIPDRLDLVNTNKMAEIASVSIKIQGWATNAQLNLDPSLPIGYSRNADNWRPLLSIADNLGYGEQAREAMKIFLGKETYVHERILLLRDIKKLITKLEWKTVVPSELLANCLNRMEDGETTWHLNQKLLSNMLSGFEVYPKPIRWPENVPYDNRKNKRGYMLKDMELALRHYASPYLKVIEGAKLTKSNKKKK